VGVLKLVKVGFQLFLIEVLFDSGLDTLTAEALGDRGRKTVQMHSGALSAAYTALRAELTTLNTAETTTLLLLVKAL
jgi:hypothetical protein